VTSAALRAVEALRSPPGAIHFLLQRKSLQPRQKVVPGYAKFRTRKVFDADVLKFGNEGHPVQFQKEWALEQGLTPICALILCLRSL
jgi:hypothetical protein